MMHRLAPIALLFACCSPAQAQDAPLVAIAGTARYALAADGGASFLEASDPVTRATFERALGLDIEGFGPLWSQIMAGAIQLRREYDTEAETLWFNPLFDAGLAAGWERGPEGWRVVAMVPVTGEMLRGEAVSIAPVDWTGSPLKASIEARAQATWLAADERVWIGLATQSSGTAALMRAQAGEDELDRMRIAPGYQGAVADAWQALAAGDEAGLPQAVRAGLGVTGLNARLTLRPVAAFERTDGWTLAMQSPDAPRFVWIAHFANPAERDGKAVLQSWQLADIGAGQ